MAKGLFECLHEANLGQYIEKFRLHGVNTVECLTSLTIQDYTKFGITSADDRKRLFQLIHIVKGVKEERRMSSFTMETSSTQDKENKPLETSHVSRKNKLSAKDVDEIPSGLKIQWTPRKKDRAVKYNNSNSADIANQKNMHSIILSPNVSPKTSDTLPASSVLPMTNDDHVKLDGMKMDTMMTQLDNQGGILFTSTAHEPVPSHTRRIRTQDLLIHSLSDSEIVADNTVSVTVTSPTATLDATGFGAPKLKTSSVEVIDHATDKSYNYGIPGRKTKVTPVRKQSGSSTTGASRVAADTSSKIRVCVRKRPLLKKEVHAGEKDIVEMEGQQTVLLNEAKTAVDLTEFMQVHKYHYDEVFDDRCTNIEVYNNTAKPLVSFVFKRGSRATCFCYGQTGAGKTHTMLGNKDVKGLYLMAAEDIFTMLEHENTAGIEGMSVWVSYFEIYCGQLLDLLNNRQRLHPREDSRHNVCIAGLNEICVSGPQGLIRVVDQGNRLRSTGSSGVNSDSSRSHAILQIELQDGGKRKLGRFSFIDLAGSERACDTGDPNKVTRFEGAEINTSLLALKECIRALDQDHIHTPFRQSKLTQVLKDSFVGLQSKTCMIANIAPGDTSAEHTLNTLRYADRVKELRKQAPVSSTSQPSVPSNSRKPAQSNLNTSTPSNSRKPALTTPNTTTQSMLRKQALSGSTVTAGQPKTPSTGQPKTSITGQPKTPSTFSPGNTSTPVKHSKHPQQRQPTSTSTTPSSRKTSSRNTPLDKSNSKRRGSKDKTSFRKSTPTAKANKSLEKSSRNLDSSSSSKSVKDGRNKQDKKLNVSNARDVTKTPSKRTLEAKLAAKQAFLLNSSLPVWEPPQDMDLVQKQPEQIEDTSSVSLLEYDNPRFKTSAMDQESPPDDRVDQSVVVSQLKVAAHTQGKTENASHVQRQSAEDSLHNGQVEHVLSKHVENNNNNSSQLVEKADPTKDIGNLKPTDNQTVAKLDNSVNSDTNTIELLAEIDHALRNSLVSPLPDDNDNIPSKYDGETSVNSAGSRTQAFSFPDTFQNGTPRTDTLADTRSGNSHVAGFKYPETKTSSQRLPPHTVQEPGMLENPIESNHFRSQSLRSRLSGKGIEALPSSPRDPQRVAPRIVTSEERPHVRQRDRDVGVAHNDNKQRTSPENSNTSGVIVSTSFAEYLTSHGIDIPDIIISPDRKTTNARSYEHYNSYPMDPQTRYDPPVYRRTDDMQGIQDRHNHLNIRNHTKTRTVPNVNQRSAYVQYNPHQGSVSNGPISQHRRQHPDRQAVIPVAVTSPRNVSVRHDSSGRQSTGHVIRPSPIGQTHDTLSDVTNQMADKSALRIQYTPTRLAAQTAGGHSPVTVEVLPNSARSLFSPIRDHPNSSSTASHPVHHYSIPKAFAKEFVHDRSGIHLNKQFSNVQSPITKETLSQGSPRQPLSSSSSDLGRRFSYQGSPTQPESSSMKRPSLQLNLSGVVTESSMEIAKPGDQYPPELVPQHSAINRARELLLTAHAEQVDEIQHLCDKEWQLMSQLKTGEKDLPEYLTYVEDLLRSKLRCIDTFKDQLDTFAHHTPVASPRSPMEAW